MALNPNKIGFAVVCSLCGRTKQPIGRSASIFSNYCDHECEGYSLEPLSGSLWAGESESDFGYEVADVGTIIRETVKE